MEGRHLNFLCDIGELGALLAGSADIESFLHKVVEMISRHLESNVCSIYLYDEKSKVLVLKSTIGLKQEAINNVRLGLGEGLVGLCLQKLEPICEASARSNPNFKFFSEIGEENFESFLAVPITRGVEKIGALVVQHEKKNYFTALDVATLRASASQLAGAIENARALIHLNTRNDQAVTKECRSNEQCLIKGKAASPGYALAPITILSNDHDWLPDDKTIAEQTGTVEDVDNALVATGKQLEELQARLEEKLPEIASLIFTAHQMMLKDTNFVGQMKILVRKGDSPLSAVRKVAGKYIKTFKASPMAYMREKANDVEDLARRIISNLNPIGKDRIASCEGRIVIARELFPSDILKLTSENVAGIVLVSGGVTSHVAIIARSLNIPLIIANHKDLLELPKGTLMLLDADTANLYVNPRADVIRQFTLKDEAVKALESHFAKMKESTFTADGERIYLRANINLLSELSLAKELKAEGVGLYRTEFPFLIRPAFPSEDEQYLVYQTLLREMKGQTVFIRSLDVGGDKVLAYWDDAGEANPELGLRSIRFSLRHDEVFRTQLRAILRAGAGFDDLRIMFPMISGMDEFMQAKSILKKCAADLEKSGVKHHTSPKIGMMIELPSVLETLDEFAKEADFFSIGTNDFVQYMLGVDRTNDKVAEYYKPHHPSVMRALAKIVETGRRAGIDVSVCGEMAHEEKYIPFLLGIGVKIMSLDPHYLPSLQSAIMSIKLSEAKEFAEAVLAEPSVKKIEEMLAKGIARHA
ncbi:MAG: phosphoenolpyruvate--protein phosphotransferase [Planctomycetes bacterium]|nr:phosphoenolpyruvate--protein phosphotransferase [Planctomycetota bacterium]